MTVNDSKVQALATLLKRAIDNLEVKLRTEQEPLPTEHYWLGLMTMRQSWWFRDVHSEAMSATTLRISQKGIKEEIFKIIVQEMDPYIHEGNIQTAECGSINRRVSRSGFSVKDVFYNLLDNSLVHGTEKAASMFYALLGEEGMRCQHITIVSGLSLKENTEVQLTDKIQLISLSGRRKEIPIYLPLSATRTQSDAGKYYTGRCAIVEDVYISPRFINPTVTLAERLPVFVFNGIPWTRHDTMHEELCEALSLTANRIVAPVRWGSYIEENEIFKARALPVRTAWRDIPNEDPGLVANQEELSTASSILEARRRLSEQDQDRIRKTLSWWRKSKSAQDLVDAFRNLGVAIETLYLSNGSREKLRFRTARNSAWHLAKDAAEREKFNVQMKKIYDLRSKAVHTGQITDTCAERFRGIGQEFCRKSIIKIMEEGKFPDWESDVTDEDGT